MALNVITKIFLVLFLVLVNQVSANPTGNSPETIDFQSMDDEIYRQPWLSYNKIISLKSQADAMNEHDHLWWLLRKAQTENLLHNYNDFSQTILKAQALVTDSTPNELSSLLNIHAGIQARRAGKYIKSKILLTKALEQANKNQLYRIYVIGKQELAHTQGLSELFDISLSDLQEAYVEAFALEDHFLLAIINETYGSIYSYMNEHKKSAEYYQKALDTYEFLGYKAHIAEATFGVATAHRYMKKYDLAIKYFKLYEDKIAYTNNKERSYFAAYGLGMTYSEQGSCIKALAMIDKALSLEGIDDFDTELYKNRAICLIHLNKLDEAEIALDNAQKIYETMPDLMGTSWQLEVIKNRAMLADARQHYQLAYQLLNDYSQRYIDFLIKNSTARVIGVRATMELERKHIEKVLSEQRDNIKTLQNKHIKQQSKEQKYIVVFIAFLFIAVVAALIIQYRNNQKVLALSISDPLSNLYNRRYMFDYLDKLFGSNLPDKKALSIMLLDIDDFKHINDTYGHPFGDTVIRKIAEIGQRTLRAEDAMGRIGGEEFLCVLPRIDKDLCLTIAQRLVKNVNQHEFITEEGEVLHTSISIGIATLTNKTIDSDLLYSQADQALYQAKRAGKNQACVYKN